ncbi:low molecular weight protein-tyrosine-phosphatase [Yoonia litorea]|uniref:protein-tyrosine-phosphatase n=1 Tax=Yoonia litorea TaxID=1123755 RepID=A0A1I6LP26_9RHOB|nr:low molecular weight protein-tyrosine-phosphatase [Yoonia litorea]SFS05215.1 protein-tyrosine phosphatase [Yoonia litorea]
MQRLLTVCVGNICRSPIAAALLRADLPHYTVSSAGIAAVVGNDVDEHARRVAEDAGVAVGEHSARQFTKEIAAENDLILVLEGGHRREVEKIVPGISGRVMRLSRWTGDGDIPDPYRRSIEFHQAVFAQIQEATQAWAARLGGR